MHWQQIPNYNMLKRRGKDYFIHVPTWWPSYRCYFLESKILACIFCMCFSLFFFDDIPWCAGTRWWCWWILTLVGSLLLNPLIMFLWWMWRVRCLLITVWWSQPLIFPFKTAHFQSYRCCSVSCRISCRFSGQPFVANLFCPYLPNGRMDWPKTLWSCCHHHYAHPHKKKLVNGCTDLEKN